MSSKKTRLFKAGAEALRRITHVCEELYVCPLCLEAFDISAVADGSLSLEHVPPASIGGREILLTCRVCNSHAGHTIEAHLAKGRELTNFVGSFAGKEAFQGMIRLDLSDQKTNAVATIQNGQLHMHLRDELNNPEKLARLRERLDRMVDDGTWDGFKFKITPIQTFNPRLSDLSYLKAAYLAAFASLGYRYVARKELDPVRRQIQNPSDRIIPRYLVPVPGDGERAQFMISVERPFLALAVQFGRTLVFLPPVERFDSFYDGLTSELSEASRLGRLDGSQWPFPTGLHLQLDCLDTSR